MPNATGGVIAVVGRDGDGQWIGWKDSFSDACLGWDKIGDTNGFFDNTIVGGTADNDYLWTVPYAGYVFCDFPLDPPSSPGSVLTLDGWTGGWDNLVAHSEDFWVEMTCSNGRLNADPCAMSLWGPGNIVGGPGDDYVEKYGQGTWNFYTGEGNDIIYNYTSVSPTNANCGDGTGDYYNGTIAPLLANGCETVE